VALVTRFEDLKVWQEARELSKQVYELSRSPAFCADRALVDQIRRAAVSVMNNVAEGFDSGSQTEFRKFLRYAIRSTSEVQSCLYVTKDQNYISETEFRTVYTAAVLIKHKAGALVRRLSAHSRSRQKSEDMVKEPSAKYRSTTPPCRSHAHCPQHRSTAPPKNGRTAARPHRSTAASQHRSTAAPQHKANHP
jgi:four helix bundle protein